MRTEWLNERRSKEGSIDFLRIYCKEGYLDRWHGDSSKNPNLPFTHQQSLNMFSSYWRYGDFDWVNSRDLKRFPEYFIKECSEHFSAEEIWDELIENIVPNENS